MWFDLRSLLRGKEEEKVSRNVADVDSDSRDDATVYVCGRSVLAAFNLCCLLAKSFFSLRLDEMWKGGENLLITSRCEIPLIIKNVSCQQKTSLNSLWEIRTWEKLHDASTSTLGCDLVSKYSPRPTAHHKKKWEKSRQWNSIHSKFHFFVYVLISHREFFFFYPLRSRDLVDFSKLICCGWGRSRVCIPRILRFLYISIDFPLVSRWIN